MSWKKLSSGKKTEGGVIFAKPCFYFGFTCVNSQTSFAVTLYDNASAGSGTEVEDYLTDANKQMEGHSHADPVVCSKGLYLSLGGGTAIVYYAPYKEGVQ